MYTQCLISHTTIASLFASINHLTARYKEWADRITMNRREHLLSETRITFKFLEYMYM